MKMDNPPRTVEAAQEYWYAIRHCFHGSRCAAVVYCGRFRVREQCLRRPGHGPGGLYCKQHAAMIEKGAK